MSPKCASSDTEEKPNPALPTAVGERRGVPGRPHSGRPAPSRGWSPSTRALPAALAVGALLWISSFWITPPAFAQDRDDLSPSARAARAVFVEALEEFRQVGPREFEERLVAFVDRLLDPPQGGHALDPAAEKRRRRTIVIGLGVLFDGGDTLRDIPIVGSMFEGIAREDEKPFRDSICARARIHGRHDAPKHFFLAAALMSRGGPAAAAQASLLKEFEDARRFDEDPPHGSGFSYVDLAYDHAGIRFASAILGWHDPAAPGLPPPSVRAFLPEFTPLKLPERIGWQRFVAEYRGAPTEAILDRIHAAIDASLATESADSHDPTNPAASPTPRERAPEGSPSRRDG